MGLFLDSENRRAFKVYMNYPWLDEYLLAMKDETKDFKEEWQWTMCTGIPFDWKDAYLMN